MVTILNKEIPNQLNELNIEQFEEITGILNDTSYDYIEKHLKVFEVFGFTEDDFQDTSLDEFKIYVKEFNNINTKCNIKKSVVIDGYKYIGVSGKSFILSVRDTKHIEKIMKNKHKGYLSEVLSVLFKREDLSNVEHYDPTHIKHKSKLIKNLKAEYAVPYLIEIGKKLKQKVEIQNAAT